LLSEQDAQPNITLPLPLVEAGAAAPLCVSTAFLAVAFQGFWCCFVKYQRGQGKTW